LFLPVKELRWRSLMRGCPSGPSLLEGTLLRPPGAGLAADLAADLVAGLADSNLGLPKLLGPSEPPVRGLEGFAPNGFAAKGLGPPNFFGPPNGLSPAGLAPAGLAPEGLAPEGLAPVGLGRSNDPGPSKLLAGRGRNSRGASLAPSKDFGRRVGGPSVRAPSGRGRYGRSPAGRPAGRPEEAGRGEPARANPPLRGRSEPRLALLSELRSEPRSDARSKSRVGRGFSSTGSMRKPGVLVGT
jgi:hypothetical protein